MNRKILRPLLALLLLFIFALVYAGEPNQITGQVVGVSDGDTLVVRSGEKTIRVRLYGIDAPESGQDFGKRAKEFVNDLAYQKTVTLKVMDKDQYGRTVADVILPDGRNLNHEMVQSGLAWWYEVYAKNDQTLKRLQNQAKEQKAGLWSMPNATPPWTYRKSAVNGSGSDPDGEKRMMVVHVALFQYQESA